MTAVCLTKECRDDFIELSYISSSIEKRHCLSNAGHRPLK